MNVSPAGDVDVKMWPLPCTGLPLHQAFTCTPHIHEAWATMHS